MKRNKDRDPTIPVAIVLAWVVGAAGIVWPVVDRLLLTAVTVAFIAAAIGVLCYVGWRGWSELLAPRRRRRSEPGRRVRVRR